MIALWPFGNLDFNQILIRCLAVLGGFLAGFVITGALVAAASKPMGMSQSQKKLKGIVKMLGGIVAAIIVASLVFGTGDNGLGGDGGKSEKGETESDSKTKTEPFSTVVKTPNDKPVTAVAEAEDRMTITILGGAEVPGSGDDLRFYKVGAQPEPVSFSKLKVAILAKKQKLTKPLILEVYRSKKSELPVTHYAVRQLQEWVQETGKNAMEYRDLGTR